MADRTAIDRLNAVKAAMWESSENECDELKERLDFTRTHTHRSDPDTSREAARKVEPRYSLSCGYCLDFVEGEGTRGATYKEAVLAGLSQQRFSDLHRMDPPRIVWNGEKRDGCRVYVVAE